MRILQRCFYEWFYLGSFEVGAIMDLEDLGPAYP